MRIIKMDEIGRIKLPKEVWSRFPGGQRFTVEVKDNTIILRPIKTVKVELDDGTIIEIT